jgi:choline dehydrogenase-like flavoprotein
MGRRRAAGWGYESLLPYFMRSERQRGDRSLVTVAPVSSQARHPVAVALAEALATAGHPVTDDLPAGRQEGIAWAGPAIGEHGGRVSPVAAPARFPASTIPAVATDLRR